MSLRFTAVQLGLFGVCALLTAALAWLWLAPLPEYPAHDIHLRSEPSDTATPTLFSPPPREAFAEVDDRSVFNPQRTRVVAAEQQGTVTTTSLPADLTFVGVILDGDTKLAMFRTSGQPLAMSVPIGGTVEGWQVSNVEPERVVLHAGGVEQQMTLSPGKPSNAPGQNVPANMRQPPPQPPQQQPNDDNEP